MTRLAAARYARLLQSGIELICKYPFTRICGLLPVRAILQCLRCHQSKAANYLCEGCGATLGIECKACGHLCPLLEQDLPGPLHANSCFGIEIITKPATNAGTVASKFVNLFNNFWVGFWFPPNCTTQNQSLRSGRERDCFPEKSPWEAAGKAPSIFVRLRRMTHVPDALGHLAAWIAGDAWPGKHCPCQTRRPRRFTRHAM